MEERFVIAVEGAVKKPTGWSKKGDNPVLILR